MHAILMIVIWLSTGATYRGFQIEPAKCEAARIEFLAHTIAPEGGKVTATCLYQEPSV